MHILTGVSAEQSFHASGNCHWLKCYAGRLSGKPSKVPYHPALQSLQQHTLHAQAGNAGTGFLLWRLLGISVEQWSTITGMHIATQSSTDKV
jgi:hypothetical protein